MKKRKPTGPLVKNDKPRKTAESRMIARACPTESFVANFVENGRKSTKFATKFATKEPNSPLVGQALIRPTSSFTLSPTLSIRDFQIDKVSDKVSGQIEGRWISATDSRPNLPLPAV